MKDESKENMQEKEDSTVSEQTWRCDTYCRKIRHVSCEGEKNVVADSPNLCPYLDEMLY